MRKEIGIMQRVSYDSNIVQFFGACTTTEPTMLVMEYMRVSALALCRRLLKYCFSSQGLTRCEHACG